jgi:hypothetical protein
MGIWYGVTAVKYQMAINGTETMNGGHERSQSGTPLMSQLLGIKRSAEYAVAWISQATARTVEMAKTKTALASLFVTPHP